MSRRKMILMIIIVLLIAFGTYITMLYFNNDDKITTNNDDTFVNYTNETYTVDNLPYDDEYGDNNKLYGGWESKKIEVYRDSKLVSTVNDNKKVIQIYNDDKMEVCYIDENTELICKTSNYSFVNNILYVVSSDLYLSGRRYVIFKDNYLILKVNINNESNDYSMLYFIKN